MIKLKINQCWFVFLTGESSTQNWLLQDKLSTKSFYKYFHERLRKMIIRVRPDITDKWKLHHDNAPCHTALSQNFWPEKAFLLFPSPIFTWHRPLWIFPKLKNVLKGSHFASLKKFQKSVMDMLKTIPVEDFLAVLLPKVGTTSPSVCSCRRELFWRG